MAMTNIDELLRTVAGKPAAILHFCDLALYNEYDYNVWGFTNRYYPFPVSSKISPTCAGQSGFCTDGVVDGWNDTSTLQVKNYDMQIPPDAILENLEPFFYQVANFKNNSSNPQEFLTVAFKKTLTTTTTTKVTHGCKAGVKIGTKKTKKISMIGNKEYNKELTFDYNYSNEETITNTETDEYNVPSQKVVVPPHKGMRVTMSVALGYLSSDDVMISAEFLGPYYRKPVDTDTSAKYKYDLYPSLKTISQGCPDSLWTQFTKQGIGLNDETVSMSFRGKALLDSEFPATVFDVDLDEYDLETEIVTSSTKKTYGMDGVLLLETKTI